MDYKFIHEKLFAIHSHNEKGEIIYKEEDLKKFFLELKDEYKKAIKHLILQEDALNMHRVIGCLTTAQMICAFFSHVYGMEELQKWIEDDMQKL